MGFWIATGQHPCGDDYPARLPTPYDAAAYPAIPSSWPSEYRQLMTECVAFDPRDRPGIGEVAARLRDMRAAAWTYGGDLLTRAVSALSVFHASESPPVGSVVGTESYDCTLLIRRSVKLP
jgi:hypothetical protein